VKTARPGLKPDIDRDLQIELFDRLIPFIRAAEIWIAQKTVESRTKKGQVSE
jgi:hypothetical protein